MITPRECRDQIDDTAAVRCCDKWGGSCFSICAAQGGVNSLTGINGSKATFREAEHECRAHGKRLCRPSEVHHCCGTGCGFDSHHIWLNKPCDPTSFSHLPEHIVLLLLLLFLLVCGSVMYSAYVKLSHWMYGILSAWAAALPNQLTRMFEATFGPPNLKLSGKTFPPAYKAGQLFVVVDKAAGILAADIGGTSDPHARVFAKSNGKIIKADPRVSSVIKKTVNPEWRELFIIDGIDGIGETEHATLTVTLNDEDKGGDVDDPLGQVVIALQELVDSGQLATNGTWHTTTLTLVNAPKQFKPASGTIKLHLSYAHRPYLCAPVMTCRMPAIKCWAAQPKPKAVTPPKKGDPLPMRLFESVVGPPNLKLGGKTFPPASTPGQLFVVVVKATGILAADIGGTSDPYARVVAKSNGNKIMASPAKGSVIKKTVNPEWRELFIIDGITETENSTLTVRLMDEDKGAKDDDDPLGQVVIALQELMDSGELSTYGKWYGTTLTLVNNPKQFKPASGTIELYLSYAHRPYLFASAMNFFVAEPTPKIVVVVPPKGSEVVHRRVERHRQPSTDGGGLPKPKATPPPPPKDGETVTETAPSEARRQPTYESMGTPGNHGRARRQPQPSLDGPSRVDRHRQPSTDGGSLPKPKAMTPPLPPKDGETVDKPKSSGGSAENAPSEARRQTDESTSPTSDQPDRQSYEEYAEGAPRRQSSAQHAAAAPATSRPAGKTPAPAASAAPSTSRPAGIDWRTKISASPAPAASNASKRTKSSKSVRLKTQSEHGSSNGSVHDVEVGYQQLVDEDSTEANGDSADGHSADGQSADGPDSLRKMVEWVRDVYSKTCEWLLDPGQGFMRLAGSDTAADADEKRERVIMALSHLAPKNTKIKLAQAMLTWRSNHAAAKRNAEFKAKVDTKMRSRSSSPKQDGSRATSADRMATKRKNLSRGTPGQRPSRSPTRKQGEAGARPATAREERPIAELEGGRASTARAVSSPVDASADGAPAPAGFLSGLLDAMMPAPAPAPLVGSESSLAARLAAVEAQGVAGDEQRRQASGAARDAREAKALAARNVSAETTYEALKVWLSFVRWRNRAKRHKQRCMRLESAALTFIEFGDPLRVAFEMLKAKAPYWRDDGKDTDVSLSLDRFCARSRAHRQRQSLCADPKITSGVYGFAFHVKGSGLGTVVGLLDATDPHNEEAAQVWGLHLTHGALYTRAANASRGELSGQQLVPGLAADAPPFPITGDPATDEAAMFEARAVLEDESSEPYAREAARAWLRKVKKEQKKDEIIIEVQVDMDRRKISYGTADRPLVEAPVTLSHAVRPWCTFWSDQDTCTLLPRPFYERRVQKRLEHRERIAAMLPPLRARAADGSVPVYPLMKVSLESLEHILPPEVFTAATSALTPRKPITPPDTKRSPEVEEAPPEPFNYLPVYLDPNILPANASAGRDPNLLRGGTATLPARSTRRSSIPSAPGDTSDRSGWRSLRVSTPKSQRSSGRGKTAANGSAAQAPQTASLSGVPAQPLPTRARKEALPDMRGVPSQPLPMRTKKETAPHMWDVVKNSTGVYNDAYNQL